MCTKALGIILFRDVLQDFNVLVIDDDDDDFDDDDEDEEDLIRMSGSFLKAEKSNAKQKQKKQVGKTDKGTPKSEQNTPIG